MFSACEVDGCSRPSFRRGFCTTHFKRVQRHGATGGVVQELSAEERVIIAGSEFLEADQDYDAKRRAFLRAIASWMVERGWSKKGKR